MRMQSARENPRGVEARAPRDFQLENNTGDMRRVRVPLAPVLREDVKYFHVGVTGLGGGILKPPPVQSPCF